MRETIRRGVLAAGATIVLAGVFGPWVRSGASGRSSFEVFDLVERLGFAPGGWFSWVVRPWPLVPLLLVSVVVAVSANRLRWAARLAAGTGTYVAIVAIGVRRAPDIGLVRPGWGVTVALVGSVVLLIGSVAAPRRPGESGDPDAALDVDLPE